MNEQTNPDLPTLQAWRVTNAAPASRFIFERNPFYHRVDGTGSNCPMSTAIVLDVAAGGLMAAKANAGETDLLVRGLTMADIPILKEGERAKGYKTLLWPSARGSEIALYPNLNTTDPVWRALNRDVRFRRALSLGIDRRTLNNALLFGLGVEGNNTVMSESPLFAPDLRTAHASYDPAAASRLLDEIGLTKRNGAGTRLLPDGRELEIIVETDGEGGLAVDGLTLIAEFWREIGVRLFVKPQDRTVLRNRAYSGLTVMVAAQGLDNAIPTALMPPTELAPMSQAFYSWPKWGQYVETKGKNGEPCDIPEAQRLIDLYRDWMATGDAATQARVWREMLHNHADNQWSIGTVAGALQPVVVKAGMRTCRHGRSIAGSRPPCSASTAWTSSTGSARWAGRRRRDDQVPGPARAHHGRDLAHHLGSRLLHHQAAARRFPHQPDRRAPRPGRGRLGRQGRVPRQAIRARPSGLGAIPRLDRRVAGAERLLRPDPGRLGLVVRIRQAGQRGGRRRALADAARQPRRS